MKRNQLHHNQNGFEAVGVLVVVLILAVIAFAGYKVWNNSKTSNNPAATTQASAPTVPKTISNKADLSTAGTALDSASSQVNSQVNGDSLNGDINDLL